MNNSKLNFLFIGSCLGSEIEGIPVLGNLLHFSLDIDWHTKVYAFDEKHYIVEEAFLDHENCKWSKNYFKVVKNTFNWNIEKEGNQIYLQNEEIKQKTKKFIVQKGL